MINFSHTAQLHGRKVTKNTIKNKERNTNNNSKLCSHNCFFFDCVHVHERVFIMRC